MEDNGPDDKAYPDIPLMVQVTFAPRLQGKADLMEGALLKSLAQKLDLIAGMTIENLLGNSHIIRGANKSVTLWVTRVSNDHRLIFRRTGPDSVEAVDVVSHEDLDKFMEFRP